MYMFEKFQTGSEVTFLLLNFLTERIIVFGWKKTDHFACVMIKALAFAVADKRNFDASSKIKI